MFLTVLSAHTVCLAAVSETLFELRRISKRRKSGEQTLSCIQKLTCAKVLAVQSYDHNLYLFSHDAFYPWIFPAPISPLNADVTMLVFETLSAALLYTSAFVHLMYLLCISSCFICLLSLAIRGAIFYSL